MVFITKSYQDLFGVRSYINAIISPASAPIILIKNQFIKQET